MEEEDNKLSPTGEEEEEEEEEEGEEEAEEEGEEEEGGGGGGSESPDGTSRQNPEELDEDGGGGGGGAEEEEEEEDEEEDSMADSDRPPREATPSVEYPPGIPDAPPLPDAAKHRLYEVGDDLDISPNALNIRWSFGLNKNVAVINLSETSSGRRSALYVCAHIGILYDFQNNTQHLLQGHRNNIAATAASENRRWVVTADEGSDSTVIVWDTTTCVPVKTIFDAHDGGVSAVALTNDARFLVTISAGDVQEVSIWDWTDENNDDPLCSTTLEPTFGRQNFVVFNPQNPQQLISNSDAQVIFYEWNTSAGITFTAPKLTDNDFNKPVGKFSQSLFVANSTRALTATSLGNLVVWENLRGHVSSDQKKALKLVKIQDRGFTVLTSVDEYLVTGDGGGQVKFFDMDIKLVYCPTKGGQGSGMTKGPPSSSSSLGPINSVSFEYAPDFVGDPALGDPATIETGPFLVRDFIVGTSNAVVAVVAENASRMRRIMAEHNQSVFALASHPFESVIAVGSSSGLLKVWDYYDKRPVGTRLFDKQMSITCAAFDPTGSWLAVGFSSGAVTVLDAVSLESENHEPFKFARDSINKISFSHDSQFLATADADRCVTVFRRRTEDVDPPYIYVGKQRPHYDQISNILFGVQLDSNFPRLLSLGLDRVLVEYDLENSTKDDLRVLSSDRIEQSALPTCMTWYPPISKENFLVTANDQYKFKLFNSVTKLCRKTLLGPTYGSPLRKLEMLPLTHPNQIENYLAFITDDRIGMQMVPLDGNPHNSVTFIAHPNGVADFACSFDGRYLFTAGGTDASVHMWEINVQALEASSKLGGSNLTPFLGLLEGGVDGELFGELEDYFYYAVLLSQGVDTMGRRRVSRSVPLEEIPAVMRAMGFYPSEREIVDMINEVKFGEYVETGRYVDEIDLGDFIKLYINHRPAFGLSLERLAWAFQTLGLGEGDGPAIERETLLQSLQAKGEHMTELELAEFVVTLLGHTEEGGSSERQPFDPQITAEIIEKDMPKKISANRFCQEMLGFPLFTSDFDSASESEISRREMDAESVITRTTAPPGSPHLVTDTAYEK